MRTEKFARFVRFSGVPLSAFENTTWLSVSFGYVALCEIVCRPNDLDVGLTVFFGTNMTQNLSVNILFCISELLYHCASFLGKF